MDSSREPHGCDPEDWRTDSCPDSALSTQLWASHTWGCCWESAGGFSCVAWQVASVGARQSGVGPRPTERAAASWGLPLLRHRARPAHSRARGGHCPSFTVSANRGAVHAGGVIARLSPSHNFYRNCRRAQRRMACPQRRLPCALRCAVCTRLLQARLCPASRGRPGEDGLRSLLRHLGEAGYGGTGGRSLDLALVFKSAPGVSAGSPLGPH